MDITAFEQGQTRILTKDVPCKGGDADTKASEDRLPVAGTAHKGIFKQW
jgi:hypothetical protein